MNILKEISLTVHVSTKDINQYALLMERSFHVLFISALEAWGAKFCDVYNEENEIFWKRVKGHNQYCEAKFNPEGQIAGLWGVHRYTQLNYCAWSKYKTLECRVFPSFSTKAKAVEAVKFFYNFINDYLKDATPSSKTQGFINLLERRSPESLRPV